MANEARDITVQFSDRANSQLAGTASIQFDGDELQTDALESWFELRVLGRVSNQPANGTFRAGEEWLFQIDCYAHAGASDPSSAGSVNTVWELADKVYGAFERHKLSVLNWDTSGGGSSVGTLQFGRMEAERVPSGLAGQTYMRVACTLPATFCPA